MAKPTKTPPATPAHKQVAAAPAKTEAGPAKVPQGRPKLQTAGSGKKRPEINMDPTLVYMGKAVLKARKEMGLTQLELSKKVNCAPAAIFMVETARHNMTIKSIMLLAQALNTQTGDLFPRTLPRNAARLKEVAEVLTDSSSRIASQLRTIDRLIVELNDESES